MPVNVSQAVVNQLFTDAKMTLFQTAQDYKPQFAGLYTLEQSNGEQSAYPIMAAEAAMERLTGSPNYADAFVKNLVIVNREPYVKFMSIKRSQIERQASMSYLDRIAQTHGKAAKKLEDDIILNILQTGASTVWGPDGKYFFATDHPVSPNGVVAGTWRNLYTGTGLTPSNYETVLANLQSRLGWDGASMSFTGQIELLVSPAKRAQAKRIVESEFTSDPGVTTAGGNSNVNQGSAVVRVCPALANEPNVWYLVASGEIVKPFILQEWRGLEMVWQTSNDSDAAFEQEEYRAKVSRGLEGGGLDPHYIIRCEE